MTAISKHGSLWRRWDLHLHTPGTKLANDYKIEDGDVWDNYLDALEASDVQVFGLTDYFSCDNYFLAVEKYRERFTKGRHGRGLEGSDGATSADRHQAARHARV